MRNNQKDKSVITISSHKKNQIKTITGKCKNLQQWQKDISKRISIINQIPNTFFITENRKGKSAMEKCLRNLMEKDNEE